MKKLGMPSSGFFFLWSISFFLQKKKESENAVSWVGDLFPDSSMTDVAANNLNGASVNSPSLSTGTDGQRNTEVPPGQTDSQNQDTSNAMLGAAYSEARRPEEEGQVTLGDTADGSDPEEQTTDEEFAADDESEEEVVTDEPQTDSNMDNSNTAASPWSSFLGSALGLVGLTFAGRGNSSEENPPAENQNASGGTGNEPEVTPENLMSYLQENGSYTDPATGNEYFLDPLGRFGVTTTDPETGERTSMVRDPETGNLMDYNPNDFQNASYGNSNSTNISGDIFDPVNSLNPLTPPEEAISGEGHVFVRSSEYETNLNHFIDYENIPDKTVTAELQQPFPEMEKLEILGELIKTQMVQAWENSNPTFIEAGSRPNEEDLPPKSGRENGFFIYQNNETGEIITHNYPDDPRNNSNNMYLPNQVPDLPGFTPLATFHTHPNSILYGDGVGPSENDERTADLYGLPVIIMTHEGLFFQPPSPIKGAGAEKVTKR